VTRKCHITKIQDGRRHLGFHQTALLRRLWMDSHKIWYADANGHPKVEIVANTTIFAPSLSVACLRSPNQGA